MTPIETLRKRGEELREKATKGPWQINQRAKTAVMDDSENPCVVASCGSSTPLADQHDANAALIVHAANTLATYEEIVGVLVEALESKAWTGCITGDCPHENQSECWAELGKMAMGCESALTRAQTLAAQALEGKVGV